MPRKTRVEADGATPLEMPPQIHAGSCKCGGTCEKCIADEYVQGADGKFQGSTGEHSGSHVKSVKPEKTDLAALQTTLKKARAEGRKEDAERIEKEIKLLSDCEEILAPFPTYLQVLAIKDIHLHPSLPIHDHEDDSAYGGEDATEVFDVDRKLFCVWQPALPDIATIYYLIDGHHHLQRAKAATHFVSSKIQEDRLVSVKPEVMCRCFAESDGWSLPLVQKLSYAMNFESKKAIVADLTPFGPEHPIADEATALEKSPAEDPPKERVTTSEISEETCGGIKDGAQITDTASGVPELLTDAAEKGVLMRVRQCITRADTITKWGYRYTRSVLQDAIERARQRVNLGLMISERHHPATLDNVCDSSGCGPKFADNYDNKTGRIENIEDVAPDGRVYATRAILDTPQGRLVADAIRSGKNPVSVRWTVRGECKRVSGAVEPQRLDLVTYDDVTMPAMDGAGHVVAIMDSIDLADSNEDMTSHETEDSRGLGDPFQGVARNMVNPMPIRSNDKAVREVAGETGKKSKPHADGESISAQIDADPSSAPTQGQQGTMTPQEIRAKVRAFASQIAKGAPVNTLRTAHREAASAIKDAWLEGEDVAAYLKEYRVACDSAEDAGYHADKEAPHIELGGEMGAENMALAGWAPDLRETAEGMKKGQARQLSEKTNPNPKTMATNEIRDGEDKKEEEEKDKEEKEKKESIKAKMDSVIKDGHPIARLPVLVQDAALRDIKRNAKSPDEVEAMLTDAVTKWGVNQTTESLAAKGFKPSMLPALGTALDSSMPFNNSVVEGRPDALALEKLHLASDEYVKNAAPSRENMGIRPGHPETEALRKINRATAHKILDEWDVMLQEKVGKDKFWSGVITDSAADPLAVIASQVRNIVLADSYTTAIAQLPNQPTIMRWIGVEQFQDMRATQFCSSMGPGQGGNGGPGWEFQGGIGRVFKIAYESYQDPPGYGAEYGVFDAGLLVPENAEIPEGTIVEYWDTLFPQWRMNATSATIQGIKSIGNGPLNLSAMARNLWHMTARKARTIDLALSNEMIDIILEYGATPVTGETYTSGNHGLTNQTVYQNGPQGAAIPGAISTSVVVNLNPGKTAGTAVAFSGGAQSDDYAIYPVPGVTPGNGGQLPVAAVRLLGGSAVGTNASPYFGTNGYTRNPIVRPRPLLTLTSSGADSASTLNPITITLPAGAVLGALGSDGYIYATSTNVQNSQTPTCAMDWSRGNLVFASGVSNNGGVIGVSVTLTYSYATNFDPFPIVPGINSLATTVTGETPQMFYSRLLGQFDLTAATMTKWPRFVQPDLAIMSPTAAAFIQQATIFYKLNSPERSDLYPTEDFFAQRNNIDMARFNAPMYTGDDFIGLTRRFTTRYAIDTPWEVRGPAIKYGTAGNFLAGEGYMGWENSCIFTTQVKSGSGVVINPVARGVLLVGALQV